MILKEGVTQAAVKAPIYYAVGVAETLYRDQGLSLVITSLTDSHEDRPTSLHNVGLAVDFRTRDIQAPVVASIVRNLKVILDPLGYDVVLEANHIHVEYQPKLGENWQSIDHPVTIA
jgi:hypothetical protein